MQNRFTLELGENCSFCAKKRTGWFCNFSPEVLLEYNAIGTTIVLPPGGVLFAEGQIPRFVATLCNGRIKLTRSSRDGRTLLLKLAKPGDVLGLHAILRDIPYEVTAQATEPSQIRCFPQKDFLHFLNRYAESGMHAAESLGKEYITALNEASRLALSPTIAGRIADLLLELAIEDEVNTTPQPEIHMSLKHEDLAFMLGSSRESVTRALNDLKRDGIIAIRGTKIILLRKDALERLF